MADFFPLSPPISNKGAKVTSYHMILLKSVNIFRDLLGWHFVPPRQAQKLKKSPGENRVHQNLVPLTKRQRCSYYSMFISVTEDYSGGK